MEDKRHRSKNFTEREKELLIDLVKDYKETVENKKNDNITNKKKNECWEKILEGYNVHQESGIRNVEQVKNLYECLKKKAKKLCLEKGTDGDDIKWKLDKISQKIMAMLSEQLIPLTNIYDSDSSYIDNATDDFQVIEELIVENSSEAEPTTSIEEVQHITEAMVTRRKRSADSSNVHYEQAGNLAKPEILENKMKEIFYAKLNAVKLKIYETDLKIKQEELEAKRRKHAAEEYEAQMKKEILTLDLEAARVKLLQLKNGHNRY